MGFVGGISIPGVPAVAIKVVLAAVILFVLIGVGFAIYKWGPKKLKKENQDSPANKNNQPPQVYGQGQPIQPLPPIQPVQVYGQGQPIQQIQPIQPIQPLQPVAQPYGQVQPIQPAQSPQPPQPAHSNLPFKRGQYYGQPGYTHSSPLPSPSPRVASRRSQRQKSSTGSAYISNGRLHRDRPAPPPSSSSPVYTASRFPASPRGPVRLTYTPTPEVTPPLIGAIRLPDTPPMRRVASLPNSPSPLIEFSPDVPGSNSNRKSGKKTPSSSVSVLEI